jgi:glycine betaine/proline transport system substrate-binding protein
LTNVQLPAYSDACAAKPAEQRDCDYPEDILYKAAWAGLKDAAPDAYTLLKNMSYTTKDQIGMLAMVDAQGKTPAEAAQAWIDANKDTWSKWLPTK